MATWTVLTKTNYQQLVEELRGIIEGAREQAIRAANQEVVRMYWQLGRRITRAKLTENAGYGDSVMEDLAGDLGLDLSTLRKAVIFFKQYQNSAPWGTILTWTQYKALSAIAGEKERDFYEGQAVKFGWNKRELLRAIRGDEYALQAVGKSGGKGRRLTRPTGATYVYKAIVERVIDGDTLLLRIDLGFEVQKVQRLRLEGIDAPSGMPSGRRPSDGAAPPRAPRRRRNRARRTTASRPRRRPGSRRDLPGCPSCTRTGS